MPFPPEYILQDIHRTFLYDAELPWGVAGTDGDNETDEFKRQTNEYYEHLVRGGEEVQSREIIGRNHFDVILDLCDDSSWLARATLEMMGLVEPEPPWPA